jgi:CheY-like chemotaxis protein
MLQVSDSGIGISQDDLNRIFEPFYTKKVMGRSGTGLGLAVVWGTVMDHHGYIDVTSEDRKGTRFDLFFPVSSDATIAAPNEPVTFTYGGHGETILVVDDVEEQRVIASDILSELGYAVSTVSSGEEALSMLKRQPFDLVILDMLMPPGIDGLTTYEAMIKIRPEQKAIIASGFAETDRVKAALNLGVGQFLTKPYTITDLGTTVERELSGGENKGTTRGDSFTER